MKFFKFIQVLDQELLPERCKIHLATTNDDGENPLDVYLAGEFDDWQSWQTRKNFKRDFVISLIKLTRNRWLFAGVYTVQGCDRVDQKTRYRYRLDRRIASEELDGRLIVAFERRGRQPYLDAEQWESSLQVAEIRAERIRVAEFPGYTQTLLTKQQLDLIVKQQSTSWRSALSSVAGVYIIADQKTGKLYIGSATGDEGIWGRWCAYAQTSHGGNHELCLLLDEQGSDYAANFQYGILETADTRSSSQDILARESHWKQLLLTRPHGHNRN